MRAISCVVELDDNLTVGDWIAFASDEEMLFEQEVTSMQIEHTNIILAEPSDDIALKVEHKVKVGTAVYKLLS